MVYVVCAASCDAGDLGHPLLCLRVLYMYVSLPETVQVKSKESELRPAQRAYDTYNGQSQNLQILDNEGYGLLYDDSTICSCLMFVN